MNLNRFAGHETQNNYDWQIEAAIKSLFYFGRDAILLFDRQGTILQCNNRLLALFSCEAEEILGRQASAVLSLTKEELVRILGGQQFDRVIEAKDRILQAAFGPLFSETEIFGGYAILFDVTETKRTEAILQEKEQRMRHLVSKAGLGIVVIDQEHKVLEANRRFAEMLGYTMEEVLELHTWDWEVILSEEEIRRDFRDLSQIDVIFETKHRRKDGSIIDVEVSASGTKFTGPDGPYNVVICICRDISGRKQAEADIRYLSYHDSLTGLYNRRYLEQELKRLDRPENLPLAIIVGDVNGLKLINDAFGHLQGDILLQKAASIMKSVCRKEDIVTRWGGDEFVILLPRTPRKAALEVMERIRNNVVLADAGLIRISISLGAAVKKEAAEDVLKILVAAETDMYKTKLKERQNAIGQAIHVIHAAVLKKSPQEAQHSRRVSMLCRQIARAMGLSDYRVREMAAVGYLHDIGKICVADHILKKAGRLKSQEWQEVTRHPEVGYSILRASTDTAELAGYVLSHHERYDGSGYPAGLAGKDIPLQARILAVADAYDAMTSDRPYRKAMSVQAAVRELKACSGKQFDPEIVEIFLNKVLSKKEVAAAAAKKYLPADSQGNQGIKESTGCV